MEEQLEALGDAVRAGKIRYIGLSNETPWGLSKCLHLGESSFKFSFVAPTEKAVRR
jgi:aryl-alcohol dehydrogenase-like predicted oxidoreductase